MTRAFVALLLTGLLSHRAFAQLPLSNWSVDAPPNTVELISVDQGSSLVWMFAFKNVSAKTIIEFRVDNLKGAMSGLTTVGGVGAVAPGENIVVNFGSHALGPRKLHVGAVVFADGSHVGTPHTLALVEGEMLGVALELKRDSALLAATRNPNLNGLDMLEAELARHSAGTDEEAPASLRGIELTGVSPAYVDKLLNERPASLRIGLIRARNLISSEAGYVQWDKVTGLRKEVLGRAPMRLQPRSFIVLVGKSASLSESQTKYVKGFEEMSVAR